MIVSHEHKFIFVKTKKTAGTSIEMALSRFAGPRDIITPISPQDEPVRQELGGRGPQHCAVPWRRYTLADWRAAWTKKKGARHFNHEPAMMVRQRVGAKIWDSYFKFCFERNPWDRAVSVYYWRTRNLEPRPGFSEFLRDPAMRRRLSNFELYSIDGEIAVDHVGLFENLRGEMEAIAARLGLASGLELPRAKAQFRQDRRPYRELFTGADRALIEEICEREIARFRYRF